MTGVQLLARLTIVQIYLSKVLTTIADKLNELDSINIDLIKKELNGTDAHCDTNLALQSDKHGQKPKLFSFFRKETPWDRRKKS
jgi:hypothetical protein